MKRPQACGMEKEMVKGYDSDSVLGLAQKICDEGVQATAMFTFANGMELHTVHVGPWGRGKFLIYRDGVILVMAGTDDLATCFSTNQVEKRIDEATLFDSTNLTELFNISAVVTPT